MQSSQEMVVTLSRGWGQVWGCRNGGENLGSGKILKMDQQAFLIDWMRGKRGRSPKDDSKGFGLSELDQYPTEKAGGEADVVGFKAEVGSWPEV